MSRVVTLKDNDDQSLYPVTFVSCVYTEDGKKLIDLLDEVVNRSTAYLPLTGGTITGDLMLPADKYIRTNNSAALGATSTEIRVGNPDLNLLLRGKETRPKYLDNSSNLREIALISDLPTKTSSLTNDSGFLTGVPSTYVTKTTWATATVGGVVKVRFDADTGALYLTNDGTNP